MSFLLISPTGTRVQLFTDAVAAWDAWQAVGKGHHILVL